MANVENLKIVHLLSGEQIIAESISESTHELKVKNAVRIVVVPNKTDPSVPSVGFAPFIQFTDDKELTLNKNCVITIVTPMKEFVNQYNSLFGGIVVPETSGKIIKP
jgi:hypothetical protein